jgi:hypothetical protein
MSQHDEDGAMVCAKCGITFDCHGALSPNCVSDEQGYPTGCAKCADLGEQVRRAEVEVLLQLNQWDAAVRRRKALTEALRVLVEAVEREYGEQPGVPALVAAKELLK